MKIGTKYHFKLKKSNPTLLGGQEQLAMHSSNLNVEKLKWMYVEQLE
ncbi:hypothetical protein Q9306_19090 [Bacillus sp. WLY-B-L8]|nr:hypothetical protein [Bacillus sp. WLY-B-L8]